MTSAIGIRPSKSRAAGRAARVGLVLAGLGAVVALGGCELADHRRIHALYPDYVAGYDRVVADVIDPWTPQAAQPRPPQPTIPDYRSQVGNH